MIMPARRKNRKAQQVRVTNLDTLEQINFNAAGLDIGAVEIWACVPADRDEQAVRCFESFTVDLHALADWLAACGIETVAMESTGVYWIPVYEILEARGFKVYLVNARHLKNVPNKKTDVLDCQWIQKLHTYGLLNASFRPEAKMCALRSYLRQRDERVIKNLQRKAQKLGMQLVPAAA
jgi:transposase